MSIHATIPGTLGKDAEIRQTQGGPVCSFSIATEDRVKGSKVTTWVGCSLFGKRGEAIAQHLRKGSKVTVLGRLSTREHNGKTYLECNVSEIELQGGGARGAHEQPAQSGSTGGAYSDADYGDVADSGSDGFPF